MNERVKKIVRNILLLLSVPVIIWAFVFARGSSLNEIYQGAKVEITNPELSFVSNEEIMNTLEEQGLVPEKIKIKEVNLAGLKSSIAKNPFVDDIHLFLSSKQILHVYITQRVPALRVEHKGSLAPSYYLDEKANPLPLHEDFILDVPVVTAPLLGHTLDDLNYTTSLVRLADYIRKDSFWNASIAQLDITENKEIDLIPVLGKHIIRFGKPEFIQDKMNRLYTFYKQGIRNIDWSIYDEVDARYLGQVICRNSKGLILAEDPYESHEDEMERLRVKKEIEQEELKAQKEKEMVEKKKALEKEQLEKQKALELARLEKEKAIELARLEKEKAQQLVKLKKQEAKEKEKFEKEKMKKQDALKKEMKEKQMPIKMVKTQKEESNKKEGQQKEVVQNKTEEKKQKTTSNTPIKNK